MKRLFVMAAGAAAIIVACNDETPPTAPVVAVASVTMVPVSDSVQAGDPMLVLRHAHLAAVLKDAGGQVISVAQTGGSVDWTSSDPTKATVDAFGVVSGTGTGVARITAAISGKNDTSHIRVDTVAVASENVSPTTANVHVDSTVTLKAWPLDALGDTLKARITHWASSDTSVAVVSNADSLGIAAGNKGTITGVKAGAATITATIAGHSSTAAITVLP
jgi:uncharacterized protein YjdB